MTAKTMPQTQIKLPDMAENSRQAFWAKWFSGLLFIAAAILLVVSIAFPYWGMVLDAPQYPGGLMMRLFVNRMEGDPDTRLDEVREIDGLNHYIGMASMYDAAAIEKAIAVPGIILMVVALSINALLRRRWLWLLVIPALLFPAVFLADLAFWLNYYGQNLDPTAPLSSSIRPFTPAVLGESTIGQFKTLAYVDIGWMMAFAAAVMTGLALLIRMLDERKKPRSQ